MCIAEHPCVAQKSFRVVSSKVLRIRPGFDSSIAIRPAYILAGMATPRSAQLDCRCFSIRTRSLGSDVRLDVRSFFVISSRIKSWLTVRNSDEHEWMLATPDEPWKSLYCDELPSMEFKLPANSHLNWFGDSAINEPAFQAEWLYDR
jgi:hypothetical protein